MQQQTIWTLLIRLPSVAVWSGSALYAYAILLQTLVCEEVSKLGICSYFYLFKISDLNM